MVKTYLERCPCGSGLEAPQHLDARGIFIGYMCTQCKSEKLSGYRPEVLSDPNYECNEQIEPDI